MKMTNIRDDLATSMETPIPDRYSIVTPYSPQKHLRICQQWTTNCCFQTKNIQTLCWPVKVAASEC